MYIYTQYSFLESVHHPAMINENAAVFKTLQDSGNKGSQPRVSQLHPTALSWDELRIQTSSETSMIEFPLVVSNRKIHVTLWNCWSLKLNKVIISCRFFPYMKNGCCILNLVTMLSQSHREALISGSTEDFVTTEFVGGTQWYWWGMSGVIPSGLLEIQVL